MNQVTKLTPLSSLIAAPFIGVEFGGARFGLTPDYNRNTMVRDILYATELQVTKKASGQVNTYKLNMNYVVEPGADPNYIDYIISRAQDRKIFFSYGDASQPEYSYVREQAIISNVSPNISFATNSISYSISATSSVTLSYSIARSYPERTEKPSTVLYEVLYGNDDNGLLDLFGGLRNREKVELEGWIPRNDQKVYISGETDISPLDYVRKLVSKMIAPDGSFYAMLIHDEPDNVDGPYFEIVNSELHQGKANRYSVDIDVGYPSDVPVYSFTPTVNTSLALITPFQSQLDFDRIVNVNLAGDLVHTSTPSLTIKNGAANPALQQWWNTMTGYPVSAKLVTRGLIKPTILCDYLRINTLFFGQQYTLSGYYMVVGQVDTVSSAGYRTELSLIRVKGLEGVEESPLLKPVSSPIVKPAAANRASNQNQSFRTRRLELV